MARRSSRSGAAALCTALALVVGPLHLWSPALAGLEGPPKGGHHLTGPPEGGRHVDQTAADEAGALAARAAERIRALQREADRLAAQARTVFGDLRALEVQRELKREELAHADAELAAVAAARARAAAFCEVPTDARRRSRSASAARSAARVRRRVSRRTRSSSATAATPRLMRPKARTSLEASSNWT